MPYFKYREKASDLRCWLEAYRYWNQGGLSNVKAMLQLVAQHYVMEQEQKDIESIIGLNKSELKSLELPELEVTPDIGLLHPLLSGYASNPKSCECSNDVAMMSFNNLFIFSADYLIQSIALSSLSFRYGMEAISYNIKSGK